MMPKFPLVFFLQEDYSTCVDKRHNVDFLETLENHASLIYRLVKNVGHISTHTDIKFLYV